jgi:hypothetical protein
VLRKSISLIKQNLTRGSFNLSILTCNLATSSINHSRSIVFIYPSDCVASIVTCSGRPRLPLTDMPTQQTKRHQHYCFFLFISCGRDGAPPLNGACTWYVRMSPPGCCKRCLNWPLIFSSVTILKAFIAQLTLLEPCIATLDRTKLHDMLCPLFEN